MIWSVVILLASALSVESYISRDINERLSHGRQLKIYLSKSADRLEFTPAHGSRQTFVYWEKNHLSSTRKGRVSGTGNDRRWYIEKVTYMDEGTYSQKDLWNKEISIVRVVVIPKQNYVKCVAGESLNIYLEGLDIHDADLFFTGATANVTLVRNGAPVAQDLSEYFDRVRASSMKIEIKHVNYSDEGHYILRDRNSRIVSDTRMDLTDHHEFSGGNPLMALLLLLGIPAGICCCCRKKIFKKKASTGAVLQNTSYTVTPPPAGGPAGPCPPYNPPGQPNAGYNQGYNPNMGPAVQPPPAGPGQWTGPPPAGLNQGYPPQNPVYPPVTPAMMSPAQPPQWNGPPPGPYPPGPAAPVGYAPAPNMYSSPPPAANGEPLKQELRMENMASSPADPLLTSTTQEKAGPPPSMGSTDDAYKFEVGEKQSPNFL